MTLGSSIILSFSFAVIYFCSYVLQVQILADFDFLPRASIFFLPAGIKLVAILVGKFRGVLGVLIGRLLVEQYLGTPLLNAHLLMELIFWAVVPYALATAYLKKCDLELDLKDLTTYRLLMLSIIVAFSSSLGVQVFRYVTSSMLEFPLQKAIWSMTVGDLSGMFAVLAMVIFVTRYLKKQTINAP
jgi:uncharacterized membrane protein